MTKKMWGPAPILILLVLTALAALAAAYRANQPPTLRERVQALGPEVREIRFEVNRCLDQLDGAEVRFRRFDDEVAALRGEIARLEGLHPDGVPSESYEEYLEIFDRYNDMVPVWEARAEALRGMSERCRELTRLHNTAADSLRSLMLELEGHETPPPEPGDTATPPATSSAAPRGGPPGAP